MDSKYVDAALAHTSELARVYLIEKEFARHQVEMARLLGCTHRQIREDLKNYKAKG